MEDRLRPMSARVRWSALSIAILFVLTPTSRAAAGAWTLAPGDFNAEIRGSWFSSDTYHDAVGSRHPLVGGGLWEERSLAFRADLGFAPSKWLRWLGVVSAVGGMKSAPMNLILEVPAVSVSRKLGDPNVRELPTATGLGDALLGLRLPIRNGRFGSAIEVVWKAPLGYDRSRHLSVADSAAAGDTDGD